MKQGFDDHFSKLAPSYSLGRPQYPEELCEYLASVAPSRLKAWDVGTCGGQAAVRLASYFDEVMATGGSQHQNNTARLHPRVHYKVELSEHTSFPDSEVDLDTPAQVAQWFRLDEFYNEVRRVLKPHGILAVWCYGLESVDEKVDVVIRKLFEDLLGPYWPKRTIEDHTYQDIYFPFKELPRRTFRIEMTWTLAQLI